MTILFSKPFKYRKKYFKKNCKKSKKYAKTIEKVNIMEYNKICIGNFATIYRKKIANVTQIIYLRRFFKVAQYP